MDWATLRTEFPVTEHRAFLDHAAVSPLPRRTAQSLIRLANDMNANGSTAVSGWVERTEETRRSLAKLLNCDPFDIALLKNTSEGLGIVAKGFPSRDGDNVVLASEEYPSNQYPWMNLTHRGVSVRKVASRGSRISIDDLREAMNQDTKVVALSSVEYSSGFRNDLDAIGSLCKERGVAPLRRCDSESRRHAARSANYADRFPRQRRAQMAAWAPRHRLPLLRPDWLDRMRVAMVGWSSVTAGHDYSRVDFTLKPDARRFESGTLNYGGLAALGESVRLLLEVGQPAAQNRIRELTDYLCEQVQRIGWTVFSSRAGEDWSGIVILEKAGVDYRAARGEGQSGRRDRRRPRRPAPRQSARLQYCR